MSYPKADFHRVFPDSADREWLYSDNVQPLDGQADFVYRATNHRCRPVRIRISLDEYGSVVQSCME